MAVLLRVVIMAAVSCAMFLLLVESTASSALWWNLGVTDCGLRSSSKSCPTCAELELNRTLNDRQTDLCLDNSVPIKAIAKGTRDAIVDCQVRFHGSKWNCSTFFGQALFGEFIAINTTRETGVLQAYFAAGAIKGLATACHEERIPFCCNLNNEEPENSDDIVFRKCNENYNYAIEFFESFVSIFVTNQSSVKELAERHNIELGKEIINSTKESCVCHGISGTCTTRTCYTAISEIPDIGRSLYTKYNGAIEVEKQSPNDPTLIPAIPGRPSPKRDDLVYVDQSPSFCNANLSIGVLGVSGRPCKIDEPGANSCDNLCCGRGHYRETKIVHKEDCHFVWCCKIQCINSRNETLIEHKCN